MLSLHAHDPVPPLTGHLPMVSPQSCLREVFDRTARISDPATARIEFEALLALLRGLELGRIMRQDDTVAVAVIEHWLDRVERQHHV